MPDYKHTIKSLISSIYECQKRIMCNRRIIRELELEGKGDKKSKFVGEIMELETKILELQKELREKHYR